MTVSLFWLCVCCRFNDPAVRDKVTRVVLLWVNNHFTDFETDPAMMDFLETFESLLEQSKMLSHVSLWNQIFHFSEKQNIQVPPVGPAGTGINLTFYFLPDRSVADVEFRQRGQGAQPDGDADAAVSR